MSRRRKEHVPGCIDCGEPRVDEFQDFCESCAERRGIEAAKEARKEARTAKLDEVLKWLHDGLTDAAIAALVEYGKLKEAEDDELPVR